MKKDPDKTLYLLDISSFIFRAFFAIRSLNNKKGEPTNAVYGVASMLAKLLDEANPQNLAVCFDSKEPSFRSELYEEYKANRSAPPDDLIPQFDRITQLVEVMQMPSFKKSGVEADDLIGSAVEAWIAKSKSNQVVIVTGDKDLMQLVSDRVSVWDTMKGVVYDPKGVEEKFGVKPDQIIDYLTLVGDSSDNIPGAPGIGPKTAVQLLTEYESLDEVMKAAKSGKVTGKKGVTLVESEKLLKLSKQLVSLKTDIPLSLEEDEIKYAFQFTEECKKFLEELDFHSLSQKWQEKYSGQMGLSLGETPSIDLKDDRFESVRTEKDFAELLKEIEKQKVFTFDLETTSLNPREAQIVGIAIALNADKGFYIPVGHRDEKNQLSTEKVMSKLKPIFEDARFKKIGQNLKYDMSVLFNQGVSVKGIFADTMVAAYVLEPSGRHGLDFLASKYLDYKMLSFEEVCGKGKDQIGFDELSVETATRYAAEDAWATQRLWNLLEADLKKDADLLKVFQEIDLPLVEILTAMENEGIEVNSEFLEQLSKDFQKELTAIENKISKYTKEPINLNSPKQLSQLLFEELKLPTQGKTKTGFSTDASVLEALSSLHEVPRLLMEYREISKLKGTYVDPLPRMVDPKTNRVHASFHQTVAATGRLSSSDPNLQNIPIRSERGKLIRHAFIPKKGSVFLSADYSQIELRVLAHLSLDTELVRAFKNDEDVHKQTASDLYEKPIKEVTERERDIAKAINFGLMYGKTAFGLSQELKISRKEAQEMIEKYFIKYSAVKKMLDTQIADAREKGFTQTAFGRKRNLPDLHSKNHLVRANAERMAMNTPMQGTAADLMKLAMIKLHHELIKKGLSAKILVQVHDEVLLECPKAEVEQAKKLVIDCMENVVKFEVPLRVNTSVGATWMEL